MGTTKFGWGALTTNAPHGLAASTSAAIHSGERYVQWFKFPRDEILRGQILGIRTKKNDLLP